MGNKKKQGLIILFVLIYLGVHESGNAQKLTEEKITKANKTYQEAIDQKDSLKLAEAYFLYGKIEYAKANYQKSNEWFYKSLRIQEKQKESFEKGRIYLRLSVNAFEQDYPQVCIKYTRDALKTFKTIKSDKGLILVYGFLGQIYSKSWKSSTKPQYDSSLYYFKKAEVLAMKSKDTLAFTGIRHHIGNALVELNDEKAIKYLSSVLEVYSQRKLESPLVNITLNLAQAYIRFGKFEKVLQLLHKAEILIEKNYSNDFNPKSHLEDVYVQYYMSKGDWKNTFQHSQRKKIYDENRILADREGAVSRLNIEYETQKKESQLEKQKLELLLKDKNLKIQQRFLWIIGTLLLFTAALSIILFFLFKKNQLISQRNVVLIQEQNHRVKNNLQVISSLLNLQSKSLEDEKSKAIFNESQTRLESMVLLHRQLYENDNVELINIEDLLSDIANSVALTFGFYNITINNEMQVKWLKTDTAIVVGLIINELIINSFKHTFIEKEPLLEIVSRQNGENIEITYKDFGEENLEKTLIEKTRKSFGLKLINMLLFQINGTSKYNYLDGSAFTISFINT